MKKDFYKTYFELEKNHWHLRGKRNIVKDYLFRYNSISPQNTILLDYGCASGLFVGELAKEGFKTYGMDMSEEAIEFGRGEGVKNLQVIDPHSNQIDFPDAFFDVVFVLDVLEHIEEETFTLGEIYRVLKPGGIVISTVPAYMWLWTFHDDVAHHFRRYTLSNFLKMIKVSGSWEIIYSTYFNTLLFPVVAIVRIMTKVFGLSGWETDYDLNTKLIDKLFFSIFNTERKILKYISLPFGVSILTVFKKPSNAN